MSLLIEIIVSLLVYDNRVIKVTFSIIKNEKYLSQLLL